MRVVSIKSTSGPVLERPGDLAALLTYEATSDLTLETYNIDGWCGTAHTCGFENLVVDGVVEQGGTGRGGRCRG